MGQGRASRVPASEGPSVPEHSLTNGETGKFGRRQATEGEMGPPTPFV